jgi:hypothetical protein
LADDEYSFQKKHQPMTASKDALIDKTMTYKNSVHEFCTQYFLDGYCFPEKLEQATGDFVNYLNDLR